MLATQGFDPKQHDHSYQIKTLLNVTQSEQREQTLTSIVQTKLEFTRRARQDVDFIFLASDAKSGRLLKPQLNFYQALHIPTYATSRIYTGAQDPIHDNDLNGVQFGDMPWVLIKEGELALLKEALQNSHAAYNNSSLDRFYALGIDSYTIIPHLDRLSFGQGERFSGVTSSLSADQNLRLRRQLYWGTFKRGVARPIDSYLILSRDINVTPQ